MMQAMKVYTFDAPTPQGSAGLDQQAFLVAMSFHEGALRASEEVRDADGAPFSAVHPMVMCYAFAAELYLKSLAGVGTGRPAVRGHKLHLLLGRLSDQVRADIVANYEAATGRPSRALDYDLRGFTSAFEDWRYAFESEGQELHLNLLIAFVKATYAAIRQRCPDWPVRASQDDRLSNTPCDSITLKNLGGGIFIHAVDGTGTLNTRDS